MSIMGLLTPPARIVEGSIRFMDRDLVAMSSEDLNGIRGTELAMIVQSPVASLDPLKRVGKQMVRVQREHRKISAGDAWAKGVEMLDTVGIPDPERRARAWAHELSGGMAQRVLIAMALINDPQLLIADEPTTGLDVTVQAQILDLLRNLVAVRNLAAIVITHDLGIVAHYCDRVAVMFAGNIVEIGDVRHVLLAPHHPYTQALIASTPQQVKEHGYAHVGGPPPDLYDLPMGCHYRDRCPLAAEVCRTAPVNASVANGHEALCHFPAGEDHVA
jgi:peptide/nickel transport system ATP-binding protein/oligopeptide transport system ATP-binding protein